jgi:5-methylcytosine-specific restriction enzyme A
MPWAPPHPCSRAGCGRLTTDRYCDGCKASVERQRLVDTPWRKWYHKPEWKRKTKRFLAERSFCECAECKAKGWKLRATIVHHLTPHRGNSDLFWDESNWSPRTKAHHDRATAHEVNARR